MLIRIQGSNFVAGVVFDDGVAVKAAPIVKWAVGLNEDQLRSELNRRGLKASYVRTLTRAEID